MSGKDMQDYMPILKDQGIPNLTGAFKRGVSVQYIQAPMPADGVIVFADEGASDMASAEYGVIINNNTGLVAGTVVKLATQITVTGPTEADEMDIIIVGQLKNQQV